MSLTQRVQALNDADRRRIHAYVVAAIDWAADQRAEQVVGLSLDDNENWRWRQAGADAARAHDRSCVDDVLRQMLGLPDWEQDGAAPPNEHRGHLGGSGEAWTYADRRREHPINPAWSPT